MTQDEFNQSMRKIRAGNKEGLKEIYSEYLPYIYSIVYGVVGSKENAEDITSDFFIKLWSIADSYEEGREAHKGYLATIARNMSLDFLRKNQRMILTEDEEMPEQETEGTEDTVVGELTVMEALSKLKENEQKVVRMKILSEMTFQEIASELGIPMGTVTWRYQNAMNKLRRWGYE